MHSTIYQISKYPIEKDMYLTADEIIERSVQIIDYTNSIYKESERRQALEGLVACLPKNMFRLDPNGNSITFRGGMRVWQKKYVEQLSDLVEGIARNYSSNTTHALERYMNNPLKTDKLFAVNTGEAYNSGKLMHLINDLVIGQKLYVGAIFDYHW